MRLEYRLARDVSRVGRGAHVGEAAAMHPARFVPITFAVVAYSADERRTAWLLAYSPMMHKSDVVPPIC